MALFKNMSITSKGIALFTKAQAGNPIHFTKMRVGSGSVGTQNPLLLIDLVDGKLDVPISSITPKPEQKTATIVGNVDNTGLLDPLYICEIGIYAQDPDEGEILYGYSNCGEYGDYYAPETQGPYSWQYQIAVAIGNAANVTVELTKLNLDYTVMSTNTSFLVLSGANQKEINKAIDNTLKTLQSGTQNIPTLETTSKTLAGAINELKAKDDSFDTRITKNTNDISAVSTQMADKANKADLVLASGNIEEIEKQLENYNSYASLKDANGIYTVVDYKRADTTLYMKSTLSNPNLNENYQTNTWQFYDVNGITLLKTLIWTIAYDADGQIVSKVVI